MWNDIVQTYREDSTKWYSLGLQLQIPKGDLDAIETDYQSTERRFSEMIAIWITMGKKCIWEAFRIARENLNLYSSPKDITSYTEEMESEK